MPYLCDLAKLLGIWTQFLSRIGRLGTLLGVCLMRDTHSSCGFWLKEKAGSIQNLEKRNISSSEVVIPASCAVPAVLKLCFYKRSDGEEGRDRTFRTEKPRIHYLLSLDATVTPSSLRHE